MHIYQDPRWRWGRLATGDWKQRGNLLFNKVILSMKERGRRMSHAYIPIFKVAVVGRLATGNNVKTCCSIKKGQPEYKNYTKRSD